MLIAAHLPGILLVLVSLVVQAPVQPRPRYDLLIAGGQVVDGTGAPRRRADVAITNGKIAAIGTLARLDAAEVIDAAGLIVAPGFIDVHTHADDLADTPRAENFVRMGVTTIVAGNCGSSALDISKALTAVDQAGVSRELRHAHRPQHGPPLGDGDDGSRCRRFRSSRR